MQNIAAFVYNKTNGAYFALCLIYLFLRFFLRIFFFFHFHLWREWVFLKREVSLLLLLNKSPIFT